MATGPPDAGAAPPVRLAFLNRAHIRSQLAELLLKQRRETDLHDVRVHKPSIELEPLERLPTR
jgi:hypothetical protein